MPSTMTPEEFFAKRDRKRRKKSCKNIELKRRKKLTSDKLSLEKSKPLTSDKLHYNKSKTLTSDKLCLNKSKSLTSDKLSLEESGSKFNRSLRDVKQKGILQNDEKDDVFRFKLPDSWDEKSLFLFSKLYVFIKSKISKKIFYLKFKLQKFLILLH